MKHIFIILSVVAISLPSCTNERSSSFFRDMPLKYEVDSLSIFSDLMGSLITKKMDDNVLYMSCDDCNLIPFCGYLKYSNDSLLYSKDRDENFRLFLLFSATRLAPYTVEYSNDRVDEIRNLGRVFDKKNADSLFLFQLTPIVKQSLPDATYLKYISIRDGGIRHLTFSNSGGDYTIELSKFANVRHINKTAID
jgi:hypothetical protein